MDHRTDGAPDRTNASDASSVTYALKLELRREQRAGREERPYARALRRVLGAFLNDDSGDARGLLEDELLDLEARSDVPAEEVDAVRRALALTDPNRHGSRDLFAYYLNRMEADGRGDEPFARALRKALAAPGKTSLAKLFLWKDREESSG